MQLSTLLLLLEGRAFFPSVANLNKGDPFEGNLFCEPAWLINRFVQPMADEDLQHWLIGKSKKWEKERLESQATDSSFRSQIMANIYTRELRERRAAWCWFQSDLESAGMWSIYGHKGIAVRTSLEKLQSALPDSRSFQIARMRYVDRRPCAEKAFDAEGKDSQLILKLHLLKAVEYEHEHEFRVVTECPEKSGGVLVENLDWKALIEEIIISPLLPPQEVSTIQTMLNKTWEAEISKPSRLLPDSSMDTNGDFVEAIRNDNGGHYEQGLPAHIAKL